MSNRFFIFILFILSLSIKKTMCQEFSIIENNLYDNTSYFSPCHTAKSDSTEIKLITHKKIDYPDITALKLSFEMPLIKNKIGVGVSTGYEYSLLDWYHHIPLHNIENSYMTGVTIRYRIFGNFVAGGRLYYLYKDQLSKHFSGNNEPGTYQSHYTYFNYALGCAFKRNNFLTGIYYNYYNYNFKTINYISQYHSVNVLMSNIFVFRKNVFLPYFHIEAYDIFSGSRKAFDDISGKCGLYYERNKFHCNIEFIEQSLTSITLGYSFFQNTLKVSFSYYFSQFLKEPVSVFKHENLYFSNTILYKQQF